MRCQRAIIYFWNGKPESYSLIIEGMGPPGRPQGGLFRETTFKEAYELFPAVRKNWNADGTAKG